jgi:hypothetical protein
MIPVKIGETTWKIGIDTQNNMILSFLRCTGLLIKNFYDNDGNPLCWTKVEQLTATGLTTKIDEYKYTPVDEMKTKFKCSKCKQFLSIVTFTCKHTNVCRSLKSKNKSSIFSESFSEISDSNMFSSDITVNNLVDELRYLDKVSSENSEKFKSPDVFSSKSSEKDVKINLHSFLIEGKYFYFRLNIGKYCAEALVGREV